MSRKRWYYRDGLPNRVARTLDRCTSAVYALGVAPNYLVTLERHRAKTLGGLLTRLAAKVTPFTCGQVFNANLGRPLRHLADLLI